MSWLAWLAFALAIWGVAAIAFRGRNRRATVVVDFPPGGSPTVQLPDASTTTTDDLCLLILCYASKIRWLLLSEERPIQDLFAELCGEALDFWSEPGADLIDRMPTARALREEPSLTRAAGNGERFQVVLYRTDYRSLENRAWVNNTLPHPGLAANIPWSVLIILNALSARLVLSERAVLERALADWYDFAFREWAPDRSQAGLSALLAAALRCHVHARAAAAA